MTEEGRRGGGGCGGGCGVWEEEGEKVMVIFVTILFLLAWNL